jgi:[FeFe] hydrogenase H-cluster maturation GTPase HydF
MSTLNETPKGERLHIGIFGKRNAGKSQLLNAITGQDAAIVSPVKGTTTDPVYKAMELLPIGPVVLIDTPGIDDSGELGNLRIEKTKNILRKTDIALLVVDSLEGLSDDDNSLIKIYKEMNIPFLVVFNKSDLVKSDFSSVPGKTEFEPALSVSAAAGDNINELKENIIKLIEQKEQDRRLVADLIKAGEMIVLVVPIDKAAPTGRLILPQQPAIRDILDADAIAVVTKETDYANTLKTLKEPPAFVITDSQAFDRVSKETPENIGLTSFSILMARYKGVLEESVSGVKALSGIKDGDKILICEGCTHHRQCDDIGTVKIPKWIEQYTGKKPAYEFYSGAGFPSDLSGLKMIIHCGGCMLNNREMQYRYKEARGANIPITNYGVLISHIHGILDRCIMPCCPSKI